MMTKKNSTLKMEQLEAAYHATTYRVFSPSIATRTGATSEALDQLLQLNGATEWAFISACNPLSEQQSTADNEMAHQQLLHAVAAFPHFKGEGVGDDGLWEPEKSLLILGVGIAKAVELGRRFRQHAVVWGQLGEEARLVWMEPDKKAATLWKKSDICFIDYQCYLIRKPDRFQLTLIDLFYISNFKGGNATIKEKKEEVDYKLLEYSRQFQLIDEEFKDVSLVSLSMERLEVLIKMVKEICLLTKKKSSSKKIDGFSSSYLSALLNAYFPKLIPILDRRVLINSGIAKLCDLDSLDQIKKIESFYPLLISYFHAHCNQSGKSIRDLDGELFIIQIPEAYSKRFTAKNNTP